MLRDIGPPVRRPSDVYYDQIMTEPFWLNNPHLAEINVNTVMAQMANQQEAEQARQAAAEARQAAAEARQAAERARQTAAQRDAVPRYPSQWIPDYGFYNYVGHPPYEYVNPLYDEHNYKEHGHEENDYYEGNYDEQKYNGQDYQDQADEEQVEEEQEDEEQEDEEQEDEEEEDDEEGDEEHGEQGCDKQDDCQRDNGEEDDGEGDNGEEDDGDEDYGEEDEAEQELDDEAIKEKYETRAFLQEFAAMLAVANIAIGNDILCPENKRRQPPITHMEYHDHNGLFVNRVGASNQPGKIPRCVLMLCYFFRFWFYLQAHFLHVEFVNVHTEMHRSMNQMVVVMGRFCIII